MKPQRTSTVTAWMVAAVLVFSGAAETRAAVLCVGDDGHTDVEVVASFCCAEGELPPAAEPAPILIAADNRCGACVDLNLEVECVKASKSSLHIECASLLRSPGKDLGSENLVRSAWANATARENLQNAYSSVVLLI